ncbi:sigma-54-dependent Fis family transcriptional regulator [Desulfopila sp. IMCC35008]|uniref:sigma-54 interaction domain-containing protein n=1 Tax=Desulfopila sp. IMCC35008 TaxID=2653858 RepID=UPI0013D1BC8C|nr:sigma 54-interacting transcriptional regulator [Desulfopila sp. IMCC35008]
MRHLFTPHFPALLEGIPYPAMVLDRMFRIVAMNTLMEAMTGYTVERVQGLHGELVVRSSNGNSRGIRYSEVLKSETALSIHGDIINSNRRKIPIQYHISPLSGDDGETGLLVVAEDLSAQSQENKHPIRDFTSEELIGYSPKMQKVFDMIPLLAHTDASVLITGETGTGKDKIAELIHRESERSRFPFIKVNCGALPLDLLESELFGHVKGAFTGASRTKQGMFKLANRGTLFLTEIGDMPLPLQVKLLSVLDDNRFIPVGAEQVVEVDVRIIAATHRPLRTQVKNDQFREDLFYRLNVLHVHLPPLRERDSDMRYLLDHFLEKFTRALRKTIVGVTPAAMKHLLAYQYPGNIRELSNIVEYAVNICKSKKISEQHLPPYMFEKQQVMERVEEVEPVGHVEDVEQVAVEKPIQRSGSGESWSDIERKMIVEALKNNNGNRNRTGEELGWGRMKLWRKMKKYGLL